MEIVDRHRAPALDESRSETQAHALTARTTELDRLRTLVEASGWLLESLHVEDVLPRVLDLAEQRRIFEKFYRLDPQLTRGVGGTGLGLYICEELVERMGGRIWVESDGRRGAEFVVELPTAA